MNKYKRLKTIGIQFIFSIIFMISIMTLLTACKKGNTESEDFKNSGVIIKDVEGSNIHIGDGDTYFGDVYNSVDQSSNIYNNFNFFMMETSDEDAQKALEYALTNNIEKAEEYYLKAINKINEDNLTEEDGKIYNNLAIFYTQTERYDDAIAYFEKAKEIFINRYEIVIQIECNIANVICLLYGAEQAEPLYEEINSKIFEVFDYDNPIVSKITYNMQIINEKKDETITRKSEVSKRFYDYINNNLDTDKNFMDAELVVNKDGSIYCFIAYEDSIEVYGYKNEFILLRTIKADNQNILDYEFYITYDGSNYYLVTNQFFKNSPLKQYIEYYPIDNVIEGYGIQYSSEDQNYLWEIKESDIIPSVETS